MDTKNLSFTVTCCKKSFSNEGEEIEYFDIVGDIPDKFNPKYHHKVKLQVKKDSKEIFNYLYKAYTEV